MSSGRLLTTAELDSLFTSSGEKDRVKGLVLQRLRSEGWVQEVKELARQQIRDRGINETSVENLYEAVKGECRKKVSDTVKKELFREVNQFVVKNIGDPEIMDA